MSKKNKFKVFERMTEREKMLFGIGVLLKSGKVTLEEIIEKAERENGKVNGCCCCDKNKED